MQILYAKYGCINSDESFQLVHGIQSFLPCDFFFYHYSSKLISLLRSEEPGYSKTKNIETEKTKKKSSCSFVWRGHAVIIHCFDRSAKIKLMITKFPTLIQWDQKWVKWGIWAWPSWELGVIQVLPSIPSLVFHHKADQHYLPVLNSLFSTIYY